VGLLSLAVLPIALWGSKKADWLRLTHAVAVVAVAATLLGAFAIALARGARRDIVVTLGRIGGERTARLGRILGLLGVFIGLSAACALGFYGLLLLFGSS
jgi:hypothetical protein